MTEPKSQSVSGAGGRSSAVEPQLLNIKYFGIDILVFFHHSHTMLL